jgi:hypothetical protein
MLARKYGVNFSFIPSAFRKEKEDPEKGSGGETGDKPDTGPGEAAGELPENYS